MPLLTGMRSLILLDALATVPSHYRFHEIDCLQHLTVDTAAADDLLSACGTLQALQHKADIVSAFCIIFGLDIATTKLRTFTSSGVTETWT